MRKLYKIRLYNGKEERDSFCLPFTRVEPTEEDLKSLLRLTRPGWKFIDGSSNNKTEYNRIEFEYIRELTDKEL